MGLLVGDAQEFSKLHSVSGEISGEDFLYMHREMLKMEQRMLAAQGKPCVAGWKELPASISDHSWPAPLKAPDHPTGDSPSAFWQKKLDLLRRNDAMLRDPKYLRLVSLNHMAQDVELYVHNVLHLLYSDAASHCHGDWDASSTCDDLMPPWSSPLNPHFWKIHGHIDDFIGLWLEAHDYKEIASDCAGRPACYQWRGTWVGKMDMSAHR